MEHKGHKSLHRFGDLPIELWGEIIRHLDWTTAMAIRMACKYNYCSLRRAFECPTIKVTRLMSTQWDPNLTSLTIKHGRVYYLSMYMRRDRVFKTINDMARFAAEIQKIKSGQICLKPHNEAKYRCSIIDKDGEETIWGYGDERAHAVVDCTLRNVHLGSAILKTPGNFILITIGEDGPRKKLRSYRGRRRRVFSGSFQVEILLDAEGNLEWKAPPGYDYRTIYAKKVYEDLKKVITSNRAHLKRLEVPAWVAGVDEPRCTAYFTATYADKNGLEYSVQRCIVHEGSKPVMDLQNHKDSVLKTIIEIVSRVLYKPPTFSSKWLGQLSSSKGRPTLPWFKLFRPPAPCPNDTSWHSDFRF